MSTLDTLLNSPAAPTLPVTKSPEPVEKPTAAGRKANTLAAQEKAIAAASVGSTVFRSAATYLAINAEFHRIPGLLGSDKRPKGAVA